MVYQALGIYDNEDLKDETIEMLYGNSGLRLNTFRYNIGAGGAELDLYEDKLRGAESFFIADRFNGDYSVFSDVNNYDFTRDSGVMTLFEKALASGNIKEVVFFANSPHYLMTRNGKTHSDEKKQNNLKPECYKAYCQYLLVIVDYLYTNVICKYDPNIAVRISPVNEPQWDWGGEGASQEGCHFDPKDLAKFYDVFNNQLTDYNESKSLNFAMDIFESGNYKMILSTRTKFNEYMTEFEKYDFFQDITHISLHSYGANESVFYREIFADYMAKYYPNISLGTVYRNLNFLVEQKEAVRLTWGDGSERYDGNLEPHYHLLCNGCGGVFDLMMDSLEHIDTLAAANYEGTIEGHGVVFYGKCPECARKEKQKKEA